MSGGSKCGVCKITCLLAGVGALNWGLVALWNLDLVAKALGSGTAAKAAYVAIGIAGALKLVSLVKDCPCIGKGCSTK